MADIYTPEERTNIMTRNGEHRGNEKLPESLKHLGLHKEPKGIYGNPDFANKSQKIAVFIDGCFWHKCPEHFHKPSTNADYWAQKIESNVVRDREVTEKLEDDGWLVVRLWEHDL